MRKPLQVLAVIGGLSAAVLGLIAGLFLAVLPWLGLEGDTGRLPGFVVAVAFVALGCGLGLPLAATALQALSGKPSRPLRWPRFGLLALLFLLAVAIGQVVLSYAPVPWLFFPYFYVLGIVLPVVAVLSLVGRRLARGGLTTNWREVLAQVVSGAFLGTAAAFALEIGLFFVLGLVAVVLLALTPGGFEQLQTFFAEPQLAEGFPDLSHLQPLLRSPWLIGLVFFGMAVVAPAIEEAAKTLGVLLMSYRRPSQARAFLWGVAGGAGFALVEGLLNGALVLAEQQMWAFSIVARAGTVVIHCLAGGLVGLGWQALFSGRRRWRGLGCYVVAVAMHGLWNALVVGVAFAGLLTSEGAADDMIQGVGALGVALVGFVLLALLVAQFLLLLYLSQRLARTLPSPVVPEGAGSPDAGP